jgi:hypothetical protein
MFRTGKKTNRSPDLVEQRVPGDDQFGAAGDLLLVLREGQVRGERNRTASSPSSSPAGRASS